MMIHAAHNQRLALSGQRVQKITENFCCAGKTKMHGLPADQSFRAEIGAGVSFKKIRTGISDVVDDRRFRFFPLHLQHFLRAGPTENLHRPFHQARLSENSRQQFRGRPFVRIRGKTEMLIGLD